MRFTLLLLLLSSIIVQAQKFSDYFEDKTLRIDYIFGGNINTQQAFVSELVQLNGWHGRKGKLSESPILGNGQIKMYDTETKQLIYVLPFSTLFQEWLTQDEAKTTSRSFENSYLLPFPKNKAEVQISFFDHQQKETIILKHTVDPKDILIRKTNPNGVPTEVIHKAKVENPIYVAIVAEGYQEGEMDQFMHYAHETLKHLFAHEVFKKYQDHFEFVAVKAPSKDSGISQPSKNIWKSTALSSNFDTFYSERYLTTTHLKQMHTLLENTPYQHIMILANTEIYGGGGILNSYTLTTTKNPKFAPVVVHEFGHSFGGLGDEYFYPNDIFDPKGNDKIEPWERNVTSLVDFKSKWQDLVKAKTPIPTPKSMANKVKIGAFEGLEGNGLYIPTLTCRMKLNETKDFCDVCSNALEQLILYYTSEEK